MPNNPSYFIGLMSGTSLDGVDAILVDLSNQVPNLITAHSHPIPESLRNKVLSTLSPDWVGSLKSIGLLNQELGILFSDAVNQLLKGSNCTPSMIQAIGSHGQTLWHEPLGKYPFSMQLGDANLIAERTKITTVADFRSRDIAAGGQGAPLVPAFHKAMLSHPHNSRVIVNIGGIANITILPSTSTTEKVFGFDTGPGNGLLDAWITKNKQKNFDEKGVWARSGSIIPDALQVLLKDKYFSLPYPKSTGKEAFNLCWLESNLSEKIKLYKPEDIQATLLELTAISISQHIQEYSPSNCNEIYICGGGIHNTFLLERLEHHLPHASILSTTELGIDPNWMEAIAFAWLAKQTFEEKTGNLPEVTGAKGERILGVIYPA